MSLKITKLTFVSEKLFRKIEKKANANNKRPTKTFVNKILHLKPTHNNNNNNNNNNNDNNNNDNQIRVFPIE